MTRHNDFVYSTALRVVSGDRHLAQDVAQTVFIELARKSGEAAAGQCIVRLGSPAKLPKRRK